MCGNAHNKDDIKQMKRSDGGHLDNDADTWPWVFPVPGNFGFFLVFSCNSLQTIFDMFGACILSHSQGLMENGIIHIKIFGETSTPHL